MNRSQIMFSVFLLMSMPDMLYGQSSLNRSSSLSTKIEASKTKYTGSNYRGNYIWGGAMSLAWNDLSKNIIKEPIQLNTTDSSAILTVNKFNNPFFGKNDLDTASYYIKTGYGQQTVDAINHETRIKFPGKSLQDIPGKFADRDIIAYAYFSKQVTYAIPFTKDDMLFNGEKVTNFYATTKQERENVRILYYQSNDKFIVGLKLKEDSDELILAKGYSMDDPGEVVAAVSKNRKENADYMDRRDAFGVPKLQLDYHRDYNELMNKSFSNKDFTDYSIKQMFENIRFSLDEKGATAENEGIIEMGTLSTKPGGEVTYKPKLLVFNKPFWVLMIRKGSTNPYFLLGINNTMLMEKLK